MQSHSEKSDMNQYLTDFSDKLTDLNYNAEDSEESSSTQSSEPPFTYHAAPISKYIYILYWLKKHVF